MLENTRSDTLDRMRSLLRGEIAAVETYEQAIESSDDARKMGSLTAIRHDHAFAVDALRNLLLRLHDLEDVSSSGAWGRFAKTTESIATALGDRVALRALKAGEEHGIRLYESMLEDESVEPETKRLIGHHLLPRSRRHLETLDRLMTS